MSLNARRPGHKSPVPWGPVLIATGIVLLAPVWSIAVLWFGAGWQDNAWETRCYAGQPLFALGQACVAIVGLSLGAGGLIETLRTVRTRSRPRRKLYLLFAAAGIAFGLWLTIVANYPAAPMIAGAHCFADG